VAYDRAIEERSAAAGERPTRRSSEREPADSLRDKSNVTGRWLPSLTFSFCWNMNSNIRLAGRFGLATAVGLLLALALGFLFDRLFHPHRAPPHVLTPADGPLVFGLLVTLLLGLVTICLLVAGLIQAALEYRRHPAGAEQFGARAETNLGRRNRGDSL
jgi:hypothetical protein